MQNSMNYHLISCLALLFLVDFGSTTITFPTLGLSYRSAQLTPRGNDHPVVVMSGKEIVFEDASIPMEYYAGKVIMMGYRPHWDEDVCKYENEYKASCVIITSTNPYTPGSNLNKGLNQCTYSCAFEMLYTEFQQFAGDYKTYMTETLGQGVVTVDLDGTDGNAWKEMAYSPLYLINISLSGLVCVVMIVGNIINLVLIRLRRKTHMKVWIIICILLLMSGVVGNIGFVDFNCYLQVLPYRACNIFSAIRPAFVFSAINLLSFTFIDAVKMHVGGPKLIPSKFWVCCLISFGYLSMTISCAVAITYLTDYNNIIACLIIWLALELAYQTYTAILNLILSIKTIRRLKNSKIPSVKMGAKKSQVQRTTTMLIIIAICTLIYVIFVGLVNEAVNYPWFLGSTWIVYNLLLNIISLILTFSMFMSITKNMDKRKTSSKTTDSNQSTKMSKRTSSTLDLNAVTQSTESKE
jgi:uncharacterized membrane protein